MKDEKLVARIPRNATSELKIITGEYWNIPIIDVRWYSDGKPTKKGIRVNHEELRTLIQALEKIENDNKHKRNEEEIEE
mgnify:FL=1|tara:strand:- start:1819 stop:2055 length:237 start_codon:yes stop_codon:yes gene_type:complete